MSIIIGSLNHLTHCYYKILNFQFWLLVRSVFVAWAKKWSNFTYGPNLMGQSVYYSLEPNSITVLQK